MSSKSDAYVRNAYSVIQIKISMGPDIILS